MINTPLRLANITALLALGAVRDRDVLAMLATTGNATAAILRAGDAPDRPRPTLPERPTRPA